MTADALFRLAEVAEQRRDWTVAEEAYRALTLDPDAERRTEARFRLALLLADRLNRVTEGALLLRQILDEKPDAARVRLELARLHARLGHRSAAERELRAAQASGGLPPEVERAVRFFRQSLSAGKKLGGSIELALAPDSNINRATRTGTVGTIIGDFVIDPKAQAKSGVGLSARGQAYARADLSDATTLLFRTNLGAMLYRDARYNDLQTGVEAGPEFSFDASRLAVAATATWQMYGGRTFSRSVGASATWTRSLGPKGQLRLDGAATFRKNDLNRLDEGFGYSGAVNLDRAFSATTGGGIQLLHTRQNARSRAYATSVNGFSAYLFREVDRATLVANGGYSKLKADEALAIFSRRRLDNRYSLALAATFRSLSIGALAPLLRFKWERNRSTIELYGYRRRTVELGVTTAF